MKTIITILLTAIFTSTTLYFIYESKGSFAPIREKRARIPIKEAAEYAKGHREDRSYSRWRMEAKGVWYEIPALKEYLSDLEVYPAPAGYEWKVAVVFGGVKPVGGNKKKLLSMFAPILIVSGKPDIYIDAITAYNENQANPQSTWASTGLTYEQVYKLFDSMTKTPGKTCPGPGCIIFDEGNMFP